MMARLLLMMFLAVPAAMAEKAWVGGIAGCSVERAERGETLPFGCANALNLAAMANAGSKPGDMRAGAAVEAVARYRQGKRAALPAAEASNPGQ